MQRNSNVLSTNTIREEIFDLGPKLFRPRERFVTRKRERISLASTPNVDRMFTNIKDSK
jgi:hypothetical protein